MSVETTPLLLKANLKQLKLPTMLAEWEKLGRESAASNAGFSGGARQPHFDVQWDIASTVPNAVQPGLHFSASPDRGDGARMSYLRVEDNLLGIDVFFDNVGSGILQAAVDNMARHGRIVLCGQIASYNDDRLPEGPRNMMRLIYGSIRMQGFLMGDYAAEIPAALAELKKWGETGAIRHREDVRSGFKRLPTIFGALFDGSNQGTLLASIAD